MSIQKIALEFVEKRDESTFIKLQKRLTPGLNNYIYTYIQDKESRDYIIQNTFTNIWTKIHQYNSEFAFSTWAYRIARNEALLSKRWGNKNTSHDFSLSLNENKHSVDMSYEPEYEYFHNEEDGDFEKIYDFVIKEMRDLGDNLTEMMVMREIKKMKYQDIAKKLGMNINTVKTRVRFGRNELAKRAKRKYPNIVNKLFKE